MESDSIVTVTNPVLNTCIICMSDNPETIAYSGTCNCHPNLHEECFKKWVQENTSVCPICRKSNNVVIPINQRNLRNYFFCCLCFFCICVLPFTVIVFVSIYKHE